MANCPSVFYFITSHLIDCCLHILLIWWICRCVLFIISLHEVRISGEYSSLSLHRCSAGNKRASSSRHWSTVWLSAGPLKPINRAMFAVCISAVPGNIAVGQIGQKTTGCLIPSRRKYIYRVTSCQLRSTFKVPKTSGEFSKKNHTLYILDMWGG